MMINNSNKKIAVVTGGTRGIGQAIAIDLAGPHCHVIVTGRSDAEATLAGIRKKGGEGTFIRLDVSNEEQVETCFKQIADTFGGCDILVNNAGIAKDFLLMRSKLTDWQEIININLIGTLLCSRAAVKQMMKKQWGRIINLSSIVGVNGNAGQTVYSATKAAVIGLTKSLAKEVGSRNITVNAIAPGLIDTDMTGHIPEAARGDYLKNIPLGRAGTPNDIGPTVAFLASDAASYISGQVIGINGGWQ